MTFIPNWEDFEKSAELLYLRDPMNTRYCLKYSHSKGVFIVKITDNKKMDVISLMHLAVYLNVIGIVAPKQNCRFQCGFLFDDKTDQCLQYKTEVQQDVRKIDNFITNLIRHMASNDSN